MGKTGISWTDATWNPIRGCSRVSEGCRHCYAEVQAARIVRMGKGKPTAYDELVRVTKDGEPRWTGKVALDPKALALPLGWRAPRRVFVNSMSDLFHESLTNEQIAAVFGVMAAAPQHTFQVLTKRARRMREWFEWAARDFTMQQRGIAQAPHTFRAMLDAAYEILGKPRKAALDAAWRANEDDVWPLPNVWLGVSVENQDAANERIPDLLAAPATVKFLSCEPLLGPVNLCAFLVDDLHRMGRAPRIELDWVIAGCESGPGARECRVEWLRSLRDQCASAGVPFFLKQAVPAAGSLAWSTPDPAPIDVGPGAKWRPGAVIELPYLDGVQHKDFPNVD